MEHPVTGAYRGEVYTPAVDVIDDLDPNEGSDEPDPGYTEPEWEDGSAPAGDAYECDRHGEVCA